MNNDDCTKNTLSILLKINFRSKPRHRCLKDYNFSSEEKRWICQAFLANIITKEDLLPRMSEFSSRYHISLEIIEDWMIAYEDDGYFVGGKSKLNNQATRKLRDQANKYILSDEND